MMNKLLILFILFFNQSFAIAKSDIASSNELAIAEKFIESELQSPEHNNEKKLFLILGTAREFYAYRLYDKASHYYQRAIDINSAENKSEAYINLIAISINKGDKKSIEKNLSIAKKYFESHQDFFTQDISNYLNIIAASLGNESKTDINGFYGHYVREENLIKLIQDKNYQKAFIGLNPEGVERSEDDNLKITYDLLSFKLNKQKPKELKCNAKYNKYPNAYTYHILLCGLLKEKISKGKFEERSLKRATKYFTSTDPKRSYLFDLLKEIK